MRHTSKRETRERDVILIRLRRRECIIYILIGFAYEYIDMYIKPNTTAEVVCPYNGTRQEPISWSISNTEFNVGDTMGDGEGKFRISGGYGDGKSILQIVNFSVHDEDMYRCEGVHDKKLVEICFNIHMCSK